LSHSSSPFLFWLFLERGSCELFTCAILKL
jgi:hypothetical protein